MGPLRVLAALLLSGLASGLTRTASSTLSQDSKLQPEEQQKEHVQVLLWNELHGTGVDKEAASECASTCHVTTDRGYLATSDVIVVGLGRSKTEPPSRVRPSQRLVAYLNEPASAVPEFRGAEGLGAYDGEMSYRGSADVWLSPLPSSPVELLQQVAVPTASRPEAVIVYDESACAAPSQRDAFVMGLMQQMQVDAVGDCLRNKPRPENVTEAALLARYPFTLVLEDRLHTDRVGERLFDAFRAGSVPVYAGAPNIDQYLPAAARSCIVKVSDFSSPEELAKHLRHLHNTPSAYRSLLAWKSTGMSSKFVLRAVQASGSSALCRLCEWHAKNGTASRHPSPLSEWDQQAAELTLSQLPHTAKKHLAKAAGHAGQGQSAVAAAQPVGTTAAPAKSKAAQVLAQAQAAVKVQAKVGGDGLGASGDPGGSSPHCQAGCSGNGGCIDDQCVCDKGWRGPDCDIKQGRCPGFSEDVGECAGHGKCLEEVCLCSHGWIGSGCEKIDPRMNLECKLYCGERGACVGGKCKCAGGYCGDDCSRLIGECPNWCSGHGECCGSQCACEGGWWGEDCSRQGVACPFDYDCSSAGHCINGKCACDYAFADFECSTQLPTSQDPGPGPASDPRQEICPNDCNSHGSCVEDSTGPVGCDCDFGWEGKGCDIRRAVMCPVDYDCANGGVCVKGRCENCDPGFTGLDCRDEPNPVDEEPPQAAIGERASLVAYAPFGRTAQAPPELLGRYVFETDFDAPPVVFLQARDSHPQSIAIAAIGTTKRPHKFLLDGMPDDGDNTTNSTTFASMYPKQPRQHVVLMASQQLPLTVFESLKEEATVDGMANTSMPEPLRMHKDSALARNFGVIALQRGIWRLEKGGLMMVGSTVICEKLPGGETIEAAKKNLVTIPFPRAWDAKPVVMLGMMTPMLAAALPGVVGVLRVEKVTLTDFTVRLPEGICDAVNSSRSLIGNTPLQQLLELESKPADDEWGDDVDEYLTGTCVRSNPNAGTHFTDKYNLETWHDWTGINASARPCYEPNDEVEVNDTTRYDDLRDAGYGPSEEELDAETKMPNRAAKRRKVYEMKKRETAFAQLSLVYMAMPEGSDTFKGGVEVHAKVLDLPVTGQETIPVDLELGNSQTFNMSASQLETAVPTRPHVEGLMQDVANLTADRKELNFNPQTMSWEYVVRKGKADYPGVSLMSAVYDKTNKLALAVDFKPGRELEMGVSNSVNDTVDVADAAAEAAGTMMMIQEREMTGGPHALVQTAATTSAGTDPEPVVVAEANRYVVRVPDGQESDSLQVLLDRTYEKPVLIAEPLTKSPLLNEPLIARISGIVGSVAEIKLVKPTLDGQYAGDGSSSATPVVEKLNALVMEEGLYKAGDATLYAGMVKTDNINPHTGWMRVTFPRPFSGTPVVLSQIQTNLKDLSLSNPALTYLKTRHAGVDATGFSLAVEAESDAVGDMYSDISGEGVAGQWIGFVAIDVGSTITGVIDMKSANLQADQTSSVVFDSWRDIYFASALGGVAGGSDPDTSAITPTDAIKDTNTAPVFVGHTATYGSDVPCHARIQPDDGTMVRVKVENDDISSQRAMTDQGGGGPEAFAWVAVSAAGMLKATPVMPDQDESFDAATAPDDSVAGGAALLKKFLPVPVGAPQLDCPGTPVACSNHGQCNKTTGDCLCDAFWKGSACDVAKQAYVGENGKVEIDLQYRRHSHKVMLKRKYADPVVFLGPVTRSAGDQSPALLARVASIGEDFFTVFLQQPTRWFGGPPNVAGPEVVPYLVMEKGLWAIDDFGNTVEVKRITTNATAGLSSAPVPYERKRGRGASTGRKTHPVVLTQVQTARSKIMVHSVVTEIKNDYADVAIEAEMKMHRFSPLPPMPVASNSLTNLRLSTDKGIVGDSPLTTRLTGTLSFDPPVDSSQVTSIQFYWATTRNISSMLPTPDIPVRPARYGMNANFTSLIGVPTTSGQHTFTNVDVPINAKYILAISRPLMGNPAFVPILPDADNPYHPDLFPSEIDPDRIPIQQEQVGVLVMSAGIDKWDNKSFVVDRGNQLVAPNTLTWVDFYNPEKPMQLYPETLEAPPTTYLAGLDFEGTVTGVVPTHMCLGETMTQTMDKMSAKVRVEYEVKQDRGVKDLPLNMTLSYMALVQEGLLTGKKPGCPNGCSSQGQCLVSGKCDCNVGREGEDCSKTVNPAACNPPCLGNSFCSLGECECFSGFVGENCDISASEVPVVVAACPNNCSQHGVCQDDDTCLCDEGYDDDDCSLRICVGGCNEPLGGTCIDGECQCAHTYEGNNCQERVCFPSPTCGGHGTCDDEAVCQCQDGWQGVACVEQTPARPCLNKCSGHGTCNDGTCTCVEGWEAIDCSARRACPKAEYMGMEQECGGHGFCDLGVCVCGPGWVGEACEVLDPHYDSECPFNCSGRGTCMPTGCVCDMPYGGRGCRQMMDMLMDMGEVLSVVVKVTETFPVQRVDFSRTYRSPVVIAKPPSRMGEDAFAVQLLGVAPDHCNVSSVQAQLAFMRNKYQTPFELQKVGLTKSKQGRVEMGISSRTTMVEELVTFLVVEEGSWDLRNGLLMHVGKVPAERVVKYHGSFPIGFPRFYTEPPAVLAQAQTAHELLMARARIMSSRAKQAALGLDMVDARGLDDPDKLLAHLDLETKEAQMTPLDDVELGWVSIGPSTSSYKPSADPALQYQFGSRQFQYRVVTVPLATPWHHVAFDKAAKFTSPRIVADCVNGAAFGMRYHALSATGVSLGFESIGGDGGVNASASELVTDTSQSATIFVIGFGNEGSLAAHPLACPDKCGFDGLRGQCEKSKCTCDEGWAGLSCKVPVTLCPNNCSHNGACTSAGCRCRTGWLGQDCSQEAQRVKIEVVGMSGSNNQLGAEMAECPDNCNGHGDCILGVCQCTDPLWTGYSCGDPNPCKKLCSGHGECITGEGCKCGAGWGGEACDEETLQCPYDYDCGENGRCEDGQCRCDASHFGFNCQRLVDVVGSEVPPRLAKEPYIEPWLKKH